MSSTERPAERAKEILHTVEAELQKQEFGDAAVGEKLSNLKVLARNPDNVPCVYCKHGINTLAQIAFGQGCHERPIASLEAARIIANALLLRDQMQQVFADTGYAERLVHFYKQNGPDHEFVGARILFLLTYKSKMDFVTLIESHQLLNHIQDHLWKHASSMSDTEPKNTSESTSMSAMALTETSKLLYNLASKYPHQMHFFSTTVEALVSIVTYVEPSLRLLDPPVAQLLNALAIIEWPVVLLGKGRESELLLLGRRLVELLDRSTAAMKPAQLETLLIPLITVLRRLNEQGDMKVQQLLRLSLLPQDEERDKPLGHSQTLASRLLRLQTSGGLIVLPGAVSGLLFDLSDQDATKFIHNIGYGHAAGYLMTHEIPIPSNLETATTASNAANGNAQINPVTGQRLAAEKPLAMPDMSDEEKEREAERLFVLFERLKATGVVDVENPLRMAQQSGRFEELSDSEPD